MVIADGVYKAREKLSSEVKIDYYSTNIYVWMDMVVHSKIRVPQDVYCQYCLQEPNTRTHNGILVIIDYIFVGCHGDEGNLNANLLSWVVDGSKSVLFLPHADGEKGTNAPPHYPNEGFGGGALFPIKGQQMQSILKGFT